MSYRLTPKEIETISALPAQQRLAHLVKRVTDWEEIWSLRNSEGWVLSQAPSGQVAAPFWPHATYAQNCAKETWANCESVPITLDQFIEIWLPGLANDQRLVEAFPTASQSGQFIHPTELLAAITTECREAYGDNL